MKNASKGGGNMVAFVIITIFIMIGVFVCIANDVDSHKDDWRI